MTRTISDVSAARGASPIWLPLDCERPILAVGGQLKGAFALGSERHAFLSRQFGDLSELAVYQSYVRTIQECERLCRIQPEAIAHDLHPDYVSTRYAVGRDHCRGGLRVAVQHHHAHMASCMAENGLTDPVIGVIFDGTGWGPDGTVWGGEFLIGGYEAFVRGARFRCIGLAGGDQATSQPWRVGLAYLLDAGLEPDALQTRVPVDKLKNVIRLLEKGVATTLTSSAGRLFDAIASLLGLRDECHHEGQAAMELEALAASSSGGETYAFEIEASDSSGIREPLTIDTRPLVRDVVRETRRGTHRCAIAASFHRTLAVAIERTCERLRQSSGLCSVVLSGGVFQNALLREQSIQRLSAAGFQPYVHQLTPCGDGGLALGQLAVAARKLNQNPVKSEI